MENQMSINDEIFDLLLKEALIEKYSKDVRTAMENVKPHDFPPEFEKKIKKIARSIGRQERIQGVCKGLMKVLVIVAAVMGIAFGCLLTQRTVFAAVENVIKSVFDGHDDYWITGSNVTVETFNSKMRFGYVPDGYYLCSGTYSPVYVQLIYTNELYTNEHDEIMLEYFIADGLRTSVDNEHHTYKTIYHGDIEYHYYESFDDDFDNILIWQDKGYSFNILAHLPQEELVKIALNIDPCSD